MKLKKMMIFCLVLTFVVTASSMAFGAAVQKININKAPVNELVKLKQVGSKCAQRIVDYRESNGPFKNPEDIMKVKGIGAKAYEKNKDVIVVE